mmetsp:Transcript_12988/g.26027  ORF Transcript_12988/g.26027 Transcript_12988/m.26027 type:complete len:370 (+) Transcript_12988:562-1671(+)
MGRRRRRRGRGGGRRGTAAALVVDAAIYASSGDGVSSERLGGGGGARGGHRKRAVVGTSSDEWKRRRRQFRWAVGTEGDFRRRRRRRRMGRGNGGRLRLGRLWRNFGSCGDQRRCRGGGRRRLGCRRSGSVDHRCRQPQQYQQRQYQQRQWHANHHVQNPNPIPRRPRSRRRRRLLLRPHPQTRHTRRLPPLPHEGLQRMGQGHANRRIGSRHLRPLLLLRLLLKPLIRLPLIVPHLIIPRPPALHLVIRILRIRQKRNGPRALAALDVKAKALNAKIFPVDAPDGLFFGVEFATAVEEGGAGRALDGEGEHHADGDEVIFGFFGAGDELRVEVGGDIFVEDFAFSHGGLFLKSLVMVILVVRRGTKKK